MCGANGDEARRKVLRECEENETDEKKEESITLSPPLC